MLLNNFSGGKNTRKAPSLLSPIEAQIYDNIDNTSGSIKPIKGPSLDTQNVDKYFTWYYKAGEFISKPAETVYAEFQDVLYYTQDLSYPVKYDGVNAYRLGIVGPSTIPVVGLDVAGNLTGTYTYVYTYYNSSTGVESQPNPVSAEVVATADSVLLENLVVSTDPQVDKIRLYRLGGGISVYTLVIEKDNVSGNYVDNLSDVAQAGNHILDSYSNKPAPDNLKYLTESYSMLFGAVGDKLYYSDIAYPDSWPAVNFIDFEADIIGIFPVPSGILVFTEFSTYIVAGNSPADFSKYLVDLGQGCISHHTIQFIDGNLLWLSYDGICISNGGPISVITLPIVGKLSLSGVNNAIVQDRVYYLSHDEGILALDFRYGLILRELTTKVGWLGSYKDTLYAHIEGDLHTMFTGEDLEYHYKSPVLTEGNYSNLKVFKDFYIKYDGDLDIKLYIDGDIVNEKTLTGNKCYNLKALSSASGYGLEIELKGTAEISEIEYKIMGRQNGR